MITNVLNRHSRVLAVISHFRCEQWLEQCVASLVAQTRPPENIVVVDDASPQPPLDIVKKFPRVTLLVTGENVGTYRLLQSVFSRMDYDAFLLQESDDWSAPERLALMLAEAERTGAALLGTQMVNIFCDENGREELVPRPPDANAAYIANPIGHFMTFGTTLISRGVLRHLGGLASGLRYNGDMEFFRRAYHIARMANVQQTCYFRRKHSQALTARPDTGLQSPMRQALDLTLKDRARENAAAVAADRAPELRPFRTAPVVTLQHLTGPELRLNPAPAVFIVGMHRSGTSLTANLLRQSGLWIGREEELHGATPDNPEGHWENIAVTEVNDTLLNELGGGWDDVPKFPTGWPDSFPGQHQRAEAIHTSLAHPTPWGWKDPRASLLMPFWLALSPDARVIVCVRHPLEVANSLHQRGLMSYALGLKLWRAYNERLLADVPRHLRLVVHYEHFFTQPLKALKRLVEFCGLKTGEAELLKLAANVNSELRHTRFTTEQLSQTAVAPEIITLYQTLCAEAGLAEATPPAAGSGASSPRQVSLEALAYEIFQQRWRGFVQKIAPVGTRVAIVSKGDDALLRLHQRTGRHFPSDEHGHYTGYHPADDAEALAQLATAHAAGAHFLALPVTSLWWLDCYPEFHRQLEKRFTRLEAHPQIGLIYDLRSPKE